MMNANVTIDIGLWLAEFQRDTDALLSDMFQLCSAAQERRYSGDTVHSAGIVGVIIPGAEALGETAPQRAARNAFTQAMSKFSGFLDRLIATQRIAKDGIPIRRDLHGEEELFAYVKEFVDELVVTVAREGSLNLPKKLECFPGVDQGIKDMALSYSALRNALEHHHGLPKRDLTVVVRRIIPMVEGQEVTAFPVLVQAGGTIGARIVSLEKRFPANQKVLLEPQDGHELMFTLRHIIAFSIFQAHINAGSAPSPVAPTS